MTPAKQSVPNKGATLASECISVRPPQPEKALLPMLMTEFGMVTEVSPVIL